MYVKDLKASFVLLHPYDCPLKTNHMIGVLIRFESKEQWYSEHYQLALNVVFEKNNWEQTMEINLKALQGKFFKYDKQLVGIE